MSKAVLISIRPKWCELIDRGKKTVEVRKTKPKLETPFKVYIYCTYGEGLIERSDMCIPGMLIGQKVTKDTTWGNCCNGKVIGGFVCDRISPVAMTTDGLVDAVDLKTSCLSVQELLLYSGGKLPLYGWHISDLLIYDKPKPLSAFYRACRNRQETDCSVCVDLGKNECSEIRKPPQSWMYVEVPEAEKAAGGGAE